MIAAAIKQPQIDTQRLSAAYAAMQALYAFERHHRDDLRPRMALTTALDYGNGRLDVMADPGALESCRQWAADAARQASHPQARAAALAVAAACEPTVNPEAVRKLTAAALD